MTKKTVSNSASVVFLVAIAAFVLQIIFSVTRHSSRAEEAGITGVVLLFVGLALYLWGRRLKP